VTEKSIRRPPSRTRARSCLHVVTAGRVGHDRRRRRVTGWYRVSDPNRGDHLAMAAARNGAALSRGNGPRSAVLAHRPGRYPAHRLASMRPSTPNLRRTVVPTWTRTRPPLPGKGYIKWSYAFRVGHPTRRSREARYGVKTRRPPGLRRAVLLDGGPPLIDKPRTGA
jgi:hypothetical protein